MVGSPVQKVPHKHNYQNPQKGWIIAIFGAVIIIIVTLWANNLFVGINFPELFDIVLTLTLVLFVAKLLFFVPLSYRNYLRTSNPKINQSFALKATVIMPAYNEGITLANAVESMMKQSYKNYE